MKNRAPKYGPNSAQSGAALFLSIISASLLLGLLMTVLTLSAQNAAKFSVDGAAVLEARYAAYAAIEHAFSKLETEPTWNTGWSTPQSLKQNPDIKYTLAFRNSAYGSHLGSNEALLYAEGFSPQSDTPVALAALNCTAVRPSGLFKEAAFGLESLTLSNDSRVDAFDSRIGAHWYNPDETDDELQTVLENKGHVGSGQLIVLDNSIVDGDVILPDPSAFTMEGTAYQGSPKVELVGSGQFQGEEKRPSKPRELPEILPPSIRESMNGPITDIDSLSTGGDDGLRTLDPGAYSRLKVPAGKTLRLVSGDYYFKTVEVLASEIVIDRDDDGHPVRIYVAESLLFDQAKVNESHTSEHGTNPKPKWLQILFTDEAIDPVNEVPYSQCRIQDSSVNAAMVGRYLQAELEASELFGTLSASTIVAKNSKLHYDQALEDFSVDKLSRWKSRSIVEVPPGSL